MAKAKVRWTGDHSFIGTDSGNHSVVMGSVNKEMIGMKASEMLLVALAGCSSYDVVSILEKRKIKLEKLEVHVTAEQNSEPPWAFNKIHLEYFLAGEGLDAKQVEKAIELSEGKYCSVAATLKGKAEITWEYVLE
ncbi:MAG: OsmC family protein [Pelolinea sp.]|nr:OsmC family protein [Pelolinea sp.]